MRHPRLFLVLVIALLAVVVAAALMRTGGPAWGLSLCILGVGALWSGSRRNDAT
jgi:hypothetical protein